MTDHDSQETEPVFGAATSSRSGCCLSDPQIAGDAAEASAAARG